MSYVLDALEKSEKERLVGTIAGASTIGRVTTQSTQKTRMTALTVGAVLLVVGWLYYSREGDKIEHKEASRAERVAATKEQDKLPIAVKPGTAPLPETPLAAVTVTGQPPAVYQGSSHPVGAQPSAPVTIPAPPVTAPALTLSPTLTLPLTPTAAAPAAPVAVAVPVARAAVPGTPNAARVIAPVAPPAAPVVAQVARSAVQATASASPHYRAGFNARVAGITDGCLIEIKNNQNRLQKAQLAGVTCLPPQSLAGKEARLFTTHAVFTQEVRVEVLQERDFGTLVADVFDIHNILLNQTLVQQGLVNAVDERFWSDEQEARVARRGMWQNPSVWHSIP